MVDAVGGWGDGVCAAPGVQAARGPAGPHTPRHARACLPPARLTVSLLAPPSPPPSQVLPIFNLYKNKNKNLGDGIDYGQRNYDCLGELVADTLALFEQKGGDDAFINIKVSERAREGWGGKGQVAAQVGVAGAW